MARLMSLCLFFFLSVALAIPLNRRTVFNPPILIPNETTAWTAGSVETVTWNATGIPEGVPGKLQLGFLTSESENLSVILAQGFNLTDEKVQITVPNVVTRSNYIIVLFGDSGNRSPEFTIKGSSSPSSSSASASGKTSTPPPIQTSTTTRVNTPTPPIASVSDLSISASGTTASLASNSISIASRSSAALSSPPSMSSPAPSTSMGSTNPVTIRQLVLAMAMAVLIQNMLSV
ncbi:hypothetical protein MIND_00836500 [Mycena indigotica]|uniref:Uncharacterized protein n=1 Tax=Mycena indigotica TaxID=2126181 RepID=A0A8H6SJA8_9AGAR|nr:uncharacterized protein MIND_00836500 [Mycena indigotica]KAF7298885.1 hypothetical protein MIND_00836500 [Mycena indigotica]